MHPAATPPPPQTLLDQINHLLPHLLSASHSIKTFTSRWQTIRSKLSSLTSSLSLLSDSPHWSDNPLLQTLLPNLLQTLLRIQTLSLQCSSDPQNPPVGKLLMQSDLDMAANWLSKLSNDLDLLLRSGVLRHSNAIVLSQPPPGSDKEDLAFFIRDLFTRLQIGGVEFKKKAMESLLHLLENDEKSPALVSKEGNVSYLVHLLDLNTHPSIREQAIAAVSLLASASEQSRKCVFEEGGLGPLLRIIESGSMVMKEKAAMAVEAITADADNAWAVSAYGGVSVLLEACRSGSLTLQEHSLGALRNVAVVEDVRNSLSEEGAVPAVIPLLVNGTVRARENTAGLIAVLASSGEYFRALIVQQRGLQGLLLLLHESSCADTIEHVLRAIYSLCASDPVTRTLSVSTSFLVQIAEIIKHGSLLLQQISASILATLSISDGNKRAIASCMPALVKLMELPKPDGMQEMAARALVSLLTVKSNRKELVRDEKSVMRMAQMLDPRYEAVSKKFPVAVVAAVMAGGSKGCRKRLVAAGAYAHIQKLAEMEVAGARKAAQRLSGNRLKVIFGRTWRE